jgi:negative regulator of replication initiation
MNQMSFIKNSEFPVCKNCVHFQYDLEYGKCKKFGQRNLVSGENVYKYAEFHRNNESLCGLQAKYFTQERKTKLLMRHTKYKIIQNSPYFLFGSALTTLAIAFF